TIGVLKEPGKETRVSLNPEIAASFVKSNIKVLVEADAGAKAFHANRQYENGGVQIANRSAILNQNDVLLSINLPDHETLNNLKAGSVVIGVFQPLFHPAKMEELAKKNITLFSLDMLPRTTRAQAMDVLSSQANIAGYKAV